MTTLYLIRGVPGAGKTSFAYELYNVGIVDVIFEADQFFQTEYGYEFEPRMISQAHLHCQEKTRWALHQQQSVAVSNTSTTEKEVEVYQKIAEKYGAKFVSIIVESRHNGKNIHNVPDDKVQQMRNRFSVKL